MGKWIMDLRKDSGAVSWEQYLGLPGSLNTTFAYQNIEESRIKRRFGASHEEVQNENGCVYEFSLAFITI